MSEKRWLNVPDVAQISGYSEDTVYDALRSGELVGHQRKPGARWHIEMPAVDAWLRGEPYRPDVQRITRRSA